MAKGKGKKGGKKPAPKMPMPMHEAMEAKGGNKKGKGSKGCA